jgi:hypothetical protein
MKIRFIFTLYSLIYIRFEPNMSGDPFALCHLVQFPLLLESCLSIREQLVATLADTQQIYGL